MENPPSTLPLHGTSHQAQIDTTRPFRSVKEAVAVFGERCLAADVYAARSPSIAPKPCLFSSSSSSPSTQLKQTKEDETALEDLLKRLEAELTETKLELMQLKARESEMEIELASLNAELHKNMSRMAQGEAAEAGKTAAKSSLLMGGLEDDSGEEKKIESAMMMKLERSPSLAQILSIGEKEGYFGITRKERKEMKKKKKKPIIPLIGDMFSRKKSSFSLYNPLYGNGGRSHAYLS